MPLFDFSGIEREAKRFSNNPNKIKELIARATNALKEAEDSLNYYYRVSGEIQKAMDSSYRTASFHIIEEGIAQSILRQKLIEALKLNKEYNHPFFTEGLFAAIENPNIIVIDFTESIPRVFIRMNEVAGSITDFANAVRTVRGQLNSIKGSSNIPTTKERMAAHFWKEKFYIPAREGGQVTRRKYNRETKKYEKRDVTDAQIEKYWDTMKARLEASGKLAPYWEIIDKGTAVMPGKKGLEYPSNSPTNFIGNAKVGILREINKQNSRILESLRQQERETEEYIHNLRSFIRDIKDLIKKLKSLIDVEAIIKLLTDKVMSYNRKYDEAKFANLINAIRSRNLSGITITKELRVEITVPGERRFRVGIGRIIRTLDLG